MIISEEEKRMTAYHEAGHALVAAMIPDADPLHKVTIIPRGMALGVTMQFPSDDKHTYSQIIWNADRHPDGRSRGRRVVDEPASPPAPATTSSKPPTSPARWSASGA